MRMDMRSLITLIESAQTQKLDEIELGGDVDRGYIDDLRSKNYRQDKAEYAGQGELFPGAYPDLAKIHGTLAAPYKQVGKIDNFLIGLKTDEAEGETFVVFDEGTAIAWVALKAPKGNYQLHSLDGTGAQVGGVHVHKLYTGKRLSLKIYQFLLTHICDYLVADEVQTQGGKALWRKLSASKAFDVRVYSPDKGYSRRRWVGKDFDQVYNTDDLIPWVTLRGRADKIES